MKQLVPMIAIALLGGCASAPPTTMADGRTSVNCSGMLRDWGSCERQAAQLCPSNGYNVISTSVEPMPIRPGWTERLVGLADFKEPRSMVVACKNPAR